MRLSSRMGSVFTALAVVAVLLVPVGPASATLVSLTSVPDLSLVAVGPSAANRLSRFTDTFTVANVGGGDAHNVVLTLSPSAGLSFVASASDPSCTLSASRVICLASAIPAEQKRTFAVSFTTLFQDACMEVTYPVTAAVSADETELSSSNNTAELATTIACIEAPTQCNDGVDNDKDGRIDLSDLGCAVPTDNSEARDQFLSEQNQISERQRMRILSHMRMLSSSSSSRSSVASSASSSSCGRYACGEKPVQLYMNVSRQEVLPGDTVSIVAHVQNRGSDTLRDVEVVFYYDGTQFADVSSPGAVQGPSTLSWLVTLAPGSVKELRIAATVASAAVPGSTIAASLRAMGVRGYPSATVRMPVVAQLPQTGAGFLGALEDTHRFLRPIEGGSALVIFGLLTALKFLVAGGIVGRKVLARR